MEDLNIESVTRNGEAYYLINPSDVNFSVMDQAQKVSDVFALQVTKGNERDIVTRSGNFEETLNHANVGDWIVYNIGDSIGTDLMEKMQNASVKVIRADDFPKLYKKAEDTDETDYSDYDRVFKGSAFQNVSVYHYVGKPVYVARVPFNFFVHAPWGHDQFIKAGGYLIYNPNTSHDAHHDIYGVPGATHRKAGRFEKNYAKATDEKKRRIEEAFRYVLMCDRSPIAGIQFNSRDLQRAYERIGKEAGRSHHV